MIRLLKDVDLNAIPKKQLSVGGINEFGEYENKRVYVLKAERAIGRRLVGEELVHHIDYDRSNNESNNLVICPSIAYHKLLHARTDAYNATGDANKRRCNVCKEYDAVVNMTNLSTRPSVFYHKSCNAKAKR